MKLDAQPIGIRLGSTHMRAFQEASEAMDRVVPVDWIRLRTHPTYTPTPPAKAWEYMINTSDGRVWKQRITMVDPNDSNPLLIFESADEWTSAHALLNIPIRQALLGAVIHEGLTYARLELNPG